jgi:hypothetical protein
MGTNNTNTGSKEKITATQKAPPKTYSKVHTPFLGQYSDSLF